MQTPKIKKKCFKFTTMDNANSDKQCSDVRFVSFLFYYYCMITHSMYLKYSKSNLRYAYVQVLKSKKYRYVSQ